MYFFYCVRFTGSILIQGSLLFRNNEHMELIMLISEVIS